MNYWIFKVNPEHYRIDDRLLDPSPSIVWAVTRYHERIQKGDTVFLWHASAPRGICAILIIDEFPYTPQEQEIHDGFAISTDANSPTNSPYWAKCRFTRRFPVIEAGIIKKIPGLELFSFFSAFQQATNFSILRPEGTILFGFIEEYLSEEQVLKRQALIPARKPRPERVNSPKEKKAAEPKKSPSTVALLKCESCGRYVVSTDTERHIREAHNGQGVEWKKTK